jgi:hypothetical protein
MRLGPGIFLLAVGAVLTFAVRVAVSGIDLSTVGLILMLAGALSIVLEVAVFLPRRRRVTTVAQSYPAGARRRTTVDEV